MNKKFAFALVACMALLSSGAFAQSSSMTLSYDSLVTTAGNRSINVSYVDNSSVEIAGATVNLCYAYQNSSACFPATWDGAKYVFMYSYDGVNAGLLAFNASASALGYDPAYSAFGVALSDANFTVRFYLDYTKASPYVDSTLTIYALPSCYGLDGAELYQCNLTAVNAPYVNGTAVLDMYPENWTLYATDGNAVFATSSSVPVITGAQVNVNFDSIMVVGNEVGHGNYVWDASGFSFGIDWNFWKSVIGILILIGVLCAVAYFTKSAPVAIVAMILAYILLKYFSILTGAIFWIF